MQWALEAEGLHFKDLDAVCVGKGPGSYTGLRIGVSAAKGLCFALNIPLLSINSLEIIANAYNGEAEYIIPMTDARRKEVYTAIFNNKKEFICDTEAKILDENSFKELQNKKIAILGDGAKKASEILSLKKVEFFTEILPSAKSMVEISYKKFINNFFEDTAYFEPFYLKDFVAGNKK